MTDYDLPALQEVARDLAESAIGAATVGDAAGAFALVRVFAQKLADILATVAPSDEDTA